MLALDRHIVKLISLIIRFFLSQSNVNNISSGFKEIPIIFCSLYCSYTLETVSLPHLLLNLTIYPGETDSFVSNPLCLNWGVLMQTV